MINLSRDRLPVSRRWFVAGLAAATAVPSRSTVAQPALRVGVAEHLSRAFPIVVAAFTGKTRLSISIVFGRSDLLIRRMRTGERFDLFVGMGEEPVELLTREKRTLDAGKIYAYARLAVVTLADRSIVADDRLEDLRSAATDGRLERLLLPDPSVSRLGVAVDQAMAASQLAALVPSERRIYLGSSSEALRRLLAGEGDAAILAHPTVLRLRAEHQVRLALIDRGFHPKLPQRMALVADHDRRAQEFFDYLLEPPAQQIFATYGFDPVIKIV